MMVSNIDMTSSFLISIFFLIELHKCMDYDVNLGADYSDLFEIIPGQRAIDPTGKNELLLNLNFYVKTAKAAHILLAPSDEIGRESSVYEIGL